MPIIDHNPNPDPDPTPAERLAAHAAAFRHRSNAVFRDLTRLHGEMRAFVWDNPEATPQEAFAAFGADAADLHKLGLVVADMVKAYTGQEIAVVPEGRGVTANPDGTVTVT